MKTRPEENRIFRSIRKTVLDACNKSFDEIERTLIGYNMHVDFSKEERRDKLNGFFNETGVIGTLQANA